MSNYFSIRKSGLTLLMAVIGIMGSAACAQAAGKDTINASSTCVNTTIFFGSPIFDSLPFPTSVLWNFGDPASGFNNSSGAQTPRHIFSATGQYFISLRVVNNTRDTVILHDTIMVVTPVTYDFGPDIYLCEGRDTLLTAPAIPGAIYTWNDDSTSHTDTLRVRQSGVYTVSINGCGVTDSVGVFISSTPAIDLGKDHVLCVGENLELNVTTQNGEYVWTLNGAALPEQQGQLPVIAPGGRYVAMVTVPGCGVYKDTVNITFALPDAPAFSLGPDTLLCPKQVIVLNASVPGASGYDWSTGAADSAISVSDAGLYWAFVTIGGQCQVVDTVQVSYRGDRKLDFHDTAICKGSTLSLDADFGVGTYNWQAIPPQRDDQNQTGQSTYFVYRPGTYSITASVGQCVYKDTLTVSFNDSLVLSLNGDTTLCMGEDFWLQVRGNANSYAWQDGSMGATYHVTASGVYTVVAQNGCGKDTLSAKVDLVSCACQLYLPNAFTPDGDGRNDNFRPLHACEMSDFHMIVYDRNGELVFRSVDPSSAWDGTFKGAKLPSGAFVWMVRYFDEETKRPVSKKGVVMLLR